MLRERRLDLAEAFMKLGLIIGLVALFSLVTSSTMFLYFSGLAILSLLTALALVINAKE